MNNAELDEIESLLKQFDVIKDEETIGAFFEKPYTEIEQIVESRINSLFTFFGQYPKEQTMVPTFICLMILMSFSTSLHKVQSLTNNEEVTIKCEQLRTNVNSRIITLLSPFFVSFFKWDFYRRSWNIQNGDLKLAFLKKTIQNINKELKGKRNDIISKYLLLGLEYFIEKYSQMLLGFTEYEEYNIDKKAAFNVVNMMKEIVENNDIQEMAGNEREISFSGLYKTVAANYAEGLIKVFHEFDYIIIAFAEAQIEFRKFIREILTIVTPKAQKNFLIEINTALVSKNIEHVITILRSIFASVPYQLIKNTTEAYYHIFIHLILKLMGCEISSEVSTNSGRIDAVVSFDNVIYIIEFKLTDSGTAIEQIQSKNYAEQFKLQSQEIYLLGLSFNAVERNINKDYRLALLPKLN